MKLQLIFLPGSPFKCRVSDSSQVVISGAGLKMSSLARTAVFTIDPRSAEVTDCIVQVSPLAPYSSVFGIRIWRINYLSPRTAKMQISA